MTTLVTDVVFPYGTFPIDPVFHEQYAQDYSRAAFYPLPNDLPHHHPLFKGLEGTYPLAYRLPPWWPSLVAGIEPDLLKPLLASISPHEFRTGCVEHARWKTLREALSEEERRHLPTSPKLAALVEHTEWSLEFGQRGAADTSDQFTLVISTQPQDFLYMANGKEWRSCQHFRDGCENEHLPGNFYDTGVAVAMVLLPGANVRDKASVLARTTLRVFHHDQQMVVALGRTYHNNETLALLLLDELARLLDAQHLCWGMMIDVNTLEYCQDELLGPELDQRLGQETFVEGEPCWFPSSWSVPYIDGGDREWVRDWEVEHEE